MRARGTFAVVVALAAVAATTGATLAAFSAKTGSSGSTFATAASFSSCPNTTLTGGYVTGFESGRRAFSGQSLAIFNPGTVDTAIKRTGGYSMKLAPAASTVYAQWTNGGNTTANAQVVRFALHLDTLPTGNVNQLFHLNSSGGLALRYAAATQKLELALKSTSAGTPVVVSSDNAVQAGRWYSIEVRLRVASPTHIADWRIDGSPQPSASVAGANASTNTATFGSGPTTTDTFSAHYDDVVITADSSAYPLGDGRVYALRPNGMSTAAAAGVIKDDDGTDVDASSWQRLDEVPMLPTTDFIQQTAVNLNAYAEIQLDDTAETCIRAAHGYYTTHSAAHQSNRTNHVKISVFDGSRESILLNGKQLGTTTSPRDGSATVAPATTWSKAAIDGLVVRFGYSENVDNEFPKLDGVVVEYEVPQ